ncbi:hypothetical protein [Olsenella sp. oral taxon 807]|uniref:hypothetical protein n=1 Tax=Olsenella sp. oral taxon 807 TaxID=712411 RepID=UPI00209D9FB2|nr:hypothetical protein [Olsenella sp. oral taxon 807]
MAALPADENPYPGIDIVRFEPSISKMLDRTMVERAFGTKPTFHRNAPFEASLEPDVRESVGKCGKDLSENGLAVAEVIETGAFFVGRTFFDVVREAALETVEAASGRQAYGDALAADDGMRFTTDEAMRMAVEAE